MPPTASIPDGLARKHDHRTRGDRLEAKRDGRDLTSIETIDRGSGDETANDRPLEQVDAAAPKLVWLGNAPSVWPTT